MASGLTRSYCTTLAITPEDKELSYSSRSLLPPVRRIGDQTGKSANNTQDSGFVNIQVVDQGSVDTHGANGSATSPNSSVEASRREQGKRMRKRCAWLRNALRVANIVDQNGSHDSVGSFLMNVSRWKQASKEHTWYITSIGLKWCIPP